MSHDTTADPLLERPSTDRVGGLARRGAFWTLLLIVGRHAANLTATVFLARLLTPTDYGLAGMVFAVTAFFQVLSDMGLSWATIRTHELTRRQVDNLFWLNVVTGAFFWAACAAGGPILNRFYHQTGLSAIAAVLGSGFLINGFLAQPKALLGRQMQFRLLSSLEIASRVLAAAVGVTLAFAGFGYWALVGQSLAMDFTMLLGVFAFTRYRPRLPHFGHGTAALVRFGGYLAASGVADYFARNLDNVLIGRVWGPEQLGYYSRAYFLMLLPATLAAGTLSVAVIPALCALSNDPERMGRAYRQAISVIALLGFPVAIGLATAASETIHLVYGAKWLPITPLLVWLSIAGLSQPIYVSWGWLYLATGKSKALFCWSLASSVILSIGFVASVGRGVLAVAVTYAVLMGCVLTAPALYYAHRSAGLSFLPTLRVLVRPLFASALMGVSVMAVGAAMYAYAQSWPAVLCVKVIVGVTLYVAICHKRIRSLIREGRASFAF